MRRARPARIRRSVRHNRGRIVSPARQNVVTASGWRKSWRPIWWPDEPISRRTLLLTMMLAVGLAALLAAGGPWSDDDDDLAGADAVGDDGGGEELDVVGG